MSATPIPCLLQATKKSPRVPGRLAPTDSTGQFRDAAYGANPESIPLGRLWIPASLVSFASPDVQLHIWNDGWSAFLQRDQLLISADQVFSISLTTESGIGM